MNKLVLTFSFLAIYVLILGQQGDGGIPKGIIYFKESGIEIPHYAFAQPDIQKLRAEDRINDSLKAGPWRFGYNYPTSLNINNSGSWLTKENGDKVWLMKISSDQAKTINLTFSNTTIPEGNELYVYNPDRTFVLGKFTQKHIYEGELGAELISGSTVFVEYFVPVRNSDHLGNVEVSIVTHGYRTESEYQEKAFGSSGECNMNVNCPDGEPYQNQRDGVLMLVVGSSAFCSGSLINNTAFDGKPYVLTANHCYNVRPNAANWIFRFKWQSPDCNNPATSPSFESISGAVLRAKRVPTDFCLVEITGGLDNGTVPAICSPYFSGWDNTDIPPKSTFGIHHPALDIKKISFDDKPSVPAQAMNSTEANSSWKAVWDRNTTTEGGSSGSPLFNHRKQIIGQLWGGNANCNNIGRGQDFYGRIHNSWNPVASTNDAQLKYWLDPGNTGQTSIGGYDPYRPLNVNDVSVFTIEGYKENECKDSYTPSIEIFNSGTATLLSLEIQYAYNGNPIQSIMWTGNLAPYQSEMVQLPLYVNLEGVNQIAVEVLQPNGQTDEDVSDNVFEVTYEANPTGLVVDFEFYIGCFVDEVYWELQDDDNNVLYYGGGYGMNANANYLVSEEFCLTNKCYQLVLNDSGNDGVHGSSYTTCDYDGSMTLTQRADSHRLATLTEAQSDFGSIKTFNFCINNASLSKDELKNVVDIYPNPSKGLFHVTMDFPGEKMVTLTSITGKKIGVYRVNEKHLEISEIQLSAGIYILTITNEDRKVTRKLIVE